MTTPMPVRSEHLDADLAPEPEPRPDSLHFWDRETGNADDHVSVLLSLAHVDPFTEAGLDDTAMSITAAWCWACHDQGVLGETWGPAEGCAEYMTEPETWYCQCQAGYEAKEDAARRFAEATDEDEV
jgi:hypothetical protein